MSSAAPHLEDSSSPGSAGFSDTRASQDSSSDRLLRHAPLLILFLSVAVALPHLILGPNFVLDDWFNVYEGILGGPLNASTPDIATSRPGVAIAYGITFGLFGNHPLPIVIIVSLVNLASGQVLFRTAGQYLPRRIAFALTALWVVLPNHMALEIWPSTIMIGMSLLLGLVAVNLTGQDDINRAAVLIFAFASSAFYEGSMPLMCLAMFAIPKIKRSAFDFRLVAAGAATQGALAAWILTNLPSSKVIRNFIAPRDIVAAFYGVGIVPEWFESVAIVFFMVAFSMLGYTAVRNRRFDLAERLVVAGFIIMAAGILPYLRYFFTAAGPGDRLQYMTSIGGVATIIGLGLAAMRIPNFGLAVRAVGVVGLLLVLLTRVEGTVAWNQAGDDGVKILTAIEVADIDPLKLVILGPQPVYRRGVTPFLDPSNVRPAVAMLFDEPTANGFITFSEDEFLDAPAGQRVDIRSALGTD